MSLRDTLPEYYLNGVGKGGGETPPVNAFPFFNLAGFPMKITKQTPIYRNFERGIFIARV